MSWEQIRISILNQVPLNIIISTCQNLAFFKIRRRVFPDAPHHRVNHRASGKLVYYFSIIGLETS